MTVLKSTILLFALILAAGCDERSVGGERPDASVDPPDATPGIDARPRIDATTPEADAFVFVNCPAETPDTTDASGQTPLGPFTGDTAMFGMILGECYGMQIVITENEADMRRLVIEAGGIPYPELGITALTLDPDTYEWQTGSWLGTGPVHARFYRNGELSYTEGTITITAFEEPWPADPNIYPYVTATFTLEADGFQISGFVDAPLCEYLMLYCI